MALLQDNKDLISQAMREFNVLLNQQVHPDPPLPEEAMVTIVDDWVNFYIAHYRKLMTGEQQEQDRALQELQQQLYILANPFLAEYRAFLRSL
ncbi:alpha-hemoglobin-stabilizing protein [Choloepus didactylus]|uniref:alpha-hemoglobin-stabilizing protein n=1 Tax=Choloepus didactylus TaxID=27675 RepID=UPI00189F2D5B|nr:alpha-hemoglobin-stabilizing protein [Choloepus didactylus]